MSTFEVKVYKLKIEEHPNADAIELAVIGEYRSIVRKGQFKTGDLGVYIPEAAIVPAWILDKLGLTGKLAGKEHNRVKAIKLRGILSQGLIYPVNKENEEMSIDTITLEDGSLLGVYEGDVVTEKLGIVKYEPPIPTHMGGEVFNAFGCTIKYDIENWKKFPNVIQEGEDVVFTEKLHGTWCCIGFHPLQGYVITSKGLSEKGLAFKVDAEANKHNLYIRALLSTVDASGKTVIERVISRWTDKVGVYILGEIFGPGVQDLTYGQSVPQFRVFDVYFGNPGEGVYLNYDAKKEFTELMGLKMVPELYRGPYSRSKMLEFTNGNETFSGREACIREGIIITPTVERGDYELGRVILKSVSDAYLGRKNGTEFN